MAASHTGSACCLRAQSVCEHRSKKSANSISVHMGIFEEAAGVLVLESVSSESTPRKGVALVATSMTRVIGITWTWPMGPSDETPEGEAIRGGHGVRTAAGRAAAVKYDPGGRIPSARQPQAYERRRLEGGASGSKRHPTEEGTAGPSKKVKTTEVEPRAQPNGWPRRHTRLSEKQQKTSEHRDQLYAQLGFFSTRGWKR